MDNVKEQDLHVETVSMSSKTTADSPSFECHADYDPTSRPVSNDLNGEDDNVALNKISAGMSVGI